MRRWLLVWCLLVIAVAIYSHFSGMNENNKVVKSIDNRIILPPEIAKKIIPLPKLIKGIVKRDSKRTVASVKGLSQDSFRENIPKFSRYLSSKKSGHLFRDRATFIQSKELYDSANSELKLNQGGVAWLEMKGMAVTKKNLWKKGQSGYLFEKAGFVIHSKNSDEIRHNNRVIYNGNSFAVFTGALKVKADKERVEEIVAKYGLAKPRYFSSIGTGYITAPDSVDPILFVKRLRSETGIEEISLDLLHAEFLKK